MEQRFYTVSDVEKLTHKTYCTIWRWTKAGKFPLPIKPCQKLLWDVKDIEAWIEHCKKAACSIRFVDD